MDEILGGHLHSSKTRARSAERFHDELDGRVLRGMGSVRLYLANDSPYDENRQPYHTIPDRSTPGSTRTEPSAVHQDGGIKCATGASTKIRERDNITIVARNTRTLTAAGKLQRWNILGLCEMRWNNFGGTKQR